ncbi:MAG: hypothetical protein Q8K98_01365, partial [Bacteroidota bacterium]|nr:hypothetical protein [Bacteroidota bacterium]
TMSNGAVLANWGTLNIQADINIWTSGSPSPRIDNYGTFRKSNTAGITNITIVFYNYGAVKINTGTLYFTGGYTQITGETILGGGDLAANGTINILGGSLSGFGDINASVNNAGKVNPGDSLGCLKIMGTYSQTSTGGIDIQIRGRNVCSQFDKLIITGNATFQGKLNIALINPFRPIDNDSFQIISYGTRTGKFDTVSGLNIGSGFRFDTLFTSNFVTLKCIAPLNTLPIASNDTVITPENKPISISVLKNDSDADGDTVILYKFYQQI